MDRDKLRREFAKLGNRVYVVTCRDCGKLAVCIDHSEHNTNIVLSVKKMECYYCGKKELKLQSGVRTYMDKDEVRIKIEEALLQKRRK